MTQHTELIARLLEGQTYDFNTGESRNMSSAMDDAADAIKTLEAERDALQAQLAAAQGQSVNMDLLVALKLAVRQNNHDMLLTGDELRFCKAAINSAQATPIPQQVAEQAQFQGVIITQQGFAGSGSAGGEGTMLATAPQPKDMK